MRTLLLLTFALALQQFPVLAEPGSNRGLLPPTLSACVKDELSQLNAAYTKVSRDLQACVQEATSKVGKTVKTLLNDVTGTILQKVKELIQDCKLQSDDVFAAFQCIETLTGHGDFDSIQEIVSNVIDQELGEALDPLRETGTCALKAAVNLTGQIPVAVSAIVRDCVC